MNLRRGMLRLWTVLSIIWIIAVGVHACSVWPEHADWGTAYRALAWSDWLTEREMRLSQLEARLVIWPHLEWALGPPVVVLIAGIALGWAAAGFRK